MFDLMSPFQLSSCLIAHAPLIMMLIVLLYELVYLICVPVVLQLIYIHQILLFSFHMLNIISCVFALTFYLSSLSILSARGVEFQ